MTPKDIMVGFLRGDFDKMTGLPARIAYRMKKKGWRHSRLRSGKPGTWIKGIIPITFHDAMAHGAPQEQGSAEWRKDVLDSFVDCEFLPEQKS